MLVLLALWLPQGKDSIPEEPLRRAEIRVFDAGTNELLCDLRAAEVIPVGGGRLAIQQPLATMFVRDRDGRVQRFQIRANRAAYEQAEQRLHVQGEVLICSPEGLSFRAGDAIVDFKKQRVETGEAFRLAKPGLEFLGTGIAGRLDLTEGAIERDAQIVLFGSAREVLSREPPTDPKPVRTTLRGTGPMKFSQGNGKVLVRMETGVEYLREDERGMIVARGGVGSLEGSQPEGTDFRIDAVDMAGGIDLMDAHGGQVAGERLQIRGGRIQVTHRERSVLAFDGNELAAREIRIDRAEGRIEARGQPSARLVEDGGADIEAAEIDVALRQSGENGWQVRELQARGGVTARREGVSVIAPMMAVRGRTIHVLGPKHFVFEADGKPYYATARGDVRLQANGLDLDGEAYLIGPDMRMSADWIGARRGEQGQVDSVTARGAVQLKTRLQDKAMATVYGSEASLAGSRAMVRGEPEALLVSPERRVWAGEIELDRESGRFVARGAEWRPGRIRFSALPR